VPHVPQFDESVVGSTHVVPQCIGVLAPQAQSPAVHAWPPAHAVPHAPQLFGSVIVSVHALPHV
jgi:hypothetical protein